MGGGGQCCRVRQSPSPGIHSPSEMYTKRERITVNKNRPRRKGPRFVASTLLVAGATLVSLIMSVENGKVSGVFAQEQEEVARASRRSLRPLLKSHYAPLLAGAADAAAAAAASERVLNTEVEILPAVDSTGDGPGEAQDTDREDEGEEEKEKEAGGPEASLPQCYSSSAADPSAGEWHKCEHGVDDSPADMTNWSFSEREFGRNAGCSRRWAEEHASEGPMPFYDWEAENCFLDTVDADKFCRVMEGRKGLFFVGDSLTRLMTVTLASILRAVSLVAGSDQSCHDEWLACNGTLKMHYQRNDFLDTRTERLFENNTRGFDQKHCERPDLYKTRCTIFADDETLSGFDTLVVNSGAHPRPGEEYGPAMEVASQTIAASMRRLHGDDNSILVVRNTVPGHSDCDNRMFEGPVDLDVALALVDAAPEFYNYPAFFDNNRLLEEAFLSDPSDGWWFIDAYTPTIVRADLHRGGNDCLHYCIPGPTGHWVRLLYNILLVATGSDAGGEP